MIWTRKTTERWIFEKAEGYVITGANLGHLPSLLPWWNARDTRGTEIASGYGEAGLEKCKAFCQRHRDEQLDRTTKQSAATAAGDLQC